jgi:tetratricopeptide (TPR) repeat protein
MNSPHLLTRLFFSAALLVVAAAAHAQAPGSYASGGERIISSDLSVPSASIPARSPNDDLYLGGRQQRRTVDLLLANARALSEAQPPRYADAESVYLRALQIDPKEVRALVGLGGVYAAQKRYDDAIAAFERAVSIKPRSPESHYELGVVYYAAGQREAALAQRDALRAMRKGNADRLSKKLDALVAH